MKPDGRTIAQAAKPNRILYSLCIFFAAWQDIGINWNGLALYASLIFCALDIAFWFSIVRTFAIKRWLLSILATAFVTTLLMFAQSDEAAKFALKGLFSVVFLVYVASGMHTFGIRPLIRSFELTFVLTAMQFFEINVLHSSFLDPKQYIMRISEHFILGIGTDIGGTYGPYLTHDLIRVGGFSGEPGHLSLVVFAMLPFVWSRPVHRLMGIGLLGFCLSKATIFQVALFLFGWLLANFMPVAAMFTLLFGIYYAAAFYLLGLFDNSKMKFLEFNGSIFERFNGAYLFHDMDGFHKLIGAGYKSVCSVLPPEFMSVAESAGNLSASGSSSDVLCSAGVHSFFGSFMLEGGILGVLALSLIIHLTTPFPNLNPKVYRISINGYNFTLNTIVITAICSLISVHYFTFFPMIYCLLAVLLVRRNFGDTAIQG